MAGANLWLYTTPPTQPLFGTRHPLLQPGHRRKLHVKPAYQHEQPQRVSIEKKIDTPIPLQILMGVAVSQKRKRNQSMRQPVWYPTPLNPEQLCNLGIIT
eukprot:3580115-Amphidinium_carterae.1